MTNSELQKKLNSIKEIQPNKNWATNNRSVLIAEMNKNKKEEKVSAFKNFFKQVRMGFGFSLGTLMPNNLVNNFGRPVVISFFGIGIIASSMSAVGLAQEAVPGKVLYPVKIAGEKVQMAFVASDNDKIKLEMDFAGRRIFEINQLMASNTFTPEQLDRMIGETTDNLQRNINMVKSHLNQFENSGESRTALAVVREIDTKVVEYSQKLNSVNNIAVKNSKVSEMLSQVEQVGDKALEIMILRHDPSDDTISDLEIAEKLNNKIALVENSIGSDLGVGADLSVSEARGLINKGDFAAALVKITESKDIIAKMRAEMENQNSKNPETDIAPEEASVVTTSVVSTDGEQVIPEETVVNKDIEQVVDTQITVNTDIEQVISEKVLEDEVDEPVVIEEAVVSTDVEQEIVDPIVVE